MIMNTKPPAPKTIEELYANEKRLLGRKTVGLTPALTWTEIHNLIQVKSQNLSATDAEAAYKKLREGLKKAADHPEFKKLLMKFPVKSSIGMQSGLFFIVIDITLLRQLFADELGDWGGGGGKLKMRNDRNSPVSTRLGRR